VETNDLVAEDVGARSQRARDLHVPGEAVLCIIVSMYSIQQAVATNY
jgi:hypothetical protein